MTVDGARPTSHRWRRYPAAERPWLAVAGAAFIGASAVLLQAFFRPPWPLGLTALALIVPTLGFWLPTTYRLDEAGAHAKLGPFSRWMAWPAVRSARLVEQPTHPGVWLSSTAAGRFAATFRGLWLPADRGDRPSLTEIRDWVATRAERRVSPSAESADG